MKKKNARLLLHNLQCYKNAMKTQVQTTSVCWGIFHPLELKNKISGLML